MRERGRDREGDRKKKKKRERSSVRTPIPNQPTGHLLLLLSPVAARSLARCCCRCCVHREPVCSSSTSESKPHFLTPLSLFYFGEPVSAVRISSLSTSPRQRRTHCRLLLLLLLLLLLVCVCVCVCVCVPVVTSIYLSLSYLV